MNNNNKRKAVTPLKDPTPNKKQQNVRFTSGSHQQPYPTAALTVEMEVFPPARPVEIEEKDGFFNWTSPQWDPRYTMGIFGSRGTGKSFFARWFAAQHAAYYPEVYVFTETRMNRFWEQMMNPLFIYNGFDKGKILEILLRQKKKVDAWRDGKWNGNPHILIIFDDCVPEALYWEPIFRQIFFNGRHYFAGLIFNSQFFYRLPPSYRGNLDFVVSMAQEQERQKQGFFSEMAFSCGVTKFQAFASFTKMFDAATNDHNFILFDIRNKKLPSVERIYTGQAEDTGIFWMGCAYYWKNNMDHLKKIKSGEARMKAEKELDYAAYGLIDPKEDLEKKRKRQDDHKKSRKDRKLNKPLCFHEERDDDFGVSSDLRGGVDKYPLPEPFKEEDKEKPKVDFMTSYNAMLLKYGVRV